MYYFFNILGKKILEMKKKLLKIALTLFFISFNGLFSQEMLREISLKEQIDNSTLVVEGEVLSKTSFWNNNLIYTANTVRVFKVFKGAPVSTIEVITLGGTVDLEAMMVSSSLKLQTGTIGLFVLQSSDVQNQTTGKSLIKSYKPYSAIQGCYKYNLYDDIAINPFNKKKGISSAFYKEIMSATGNNYVEVSSFNTVELNKSLNQKTAFVPSITNFSPTTATAGTKTVVTINGAGFGTTKGKVGFYEADEGGGTYINALDTQVTWSDTQILVEVPSGAGTGKIRVIDAASSSTVSTGFLTVPYSELNAEYDPGTGLRAYQTQHYGQSVAGGYEWRMYTDFFNDSDKPGARLAFETALETWRCTTKINWTIRSSSDPTDKTEKDGKNMIRFDNTSELDSGVLGTCVSYWNGQSCNGTVEWYVSELDIVFDDGTTWIVDPGTPNVLGYDFQSVALHELGHGHQLGHVINTNEVMHYNLALSEYSRVLSEEDINAGNDVQARSTGTSICNILDPMTDYAGTCSLGVEDDQLKEAVKIYPNPSNGTFYISNNLNVNLQKATVYDMSGRLIFEMNLSGTSETRSINLTGMAKGMYLLHIHSDNAFVTKKLILE